MAEIPTPTPAPADPLTPLIADWRIAIRPARQYDPPTVLSIDLDRVYNAVTARLSDIYICDYRLRDQYPGNDADTDDVIRNDVAAMADFLLGQVYNRLRSILESKAPHLRNERMKTRCPVSPHMEFPAWISSTMSAIGPLRLEDGALVVYATSPATMHNYGRVPEFIEGRYSRLITSLRFIVVEMAPFPAMSDNIGSYFSTLVPHIHSGRPSYYGVAHPSHYENEDVARIFFLTTRDYSTPSEDPAMVIGYVDDDAACTALAAVAAPPGIPDGQTANSAGRQVSTRFAVNYYGFQPATEAAAGPNRGRARGFYVVGRGSERHYTCSLARSLAETELMQVLRYRLTPQI